MLTEEYQILGAERWLQFANMVIQSDGCEIALIPKAVRTFRRITISLGDGGKFR